MNKNNLIFLILMLVFLSGCGYQDIEIKDVKNVRLGKTSTKEININAEVEIFNPNNYKIKIKKYDFYVKINGREFQVNDDHADIKLSAGFNGTIPVTVRLRKTDGGIFSFDNLFLFAEIIKSRSVELEALGYFKAGVFIITKSFSVNEKRTVKFNRNK